MTQYQDLPQPIRAVLRVDCNVNNFLLDDLIAKHRASVDKPFFEKLNAQLRDEKILGMVSDPKVFEELTGMGFEKKESVRAWLERLRRHLFEDGPYPVSHDLE